MLRESDFANTLVKNGHPETDQIVEVYNGMIRRLREERLSVREKNQFLDLLIESSPLGIIILDFDDKIMEINPMALRFMGLVSGVYRGKRLQELNNLAATALANLELGEKRKVDLADSQKYLYSKMFFMDHGFKHPFYIIEEFSHEIRQAEKSAYSKLIRMMAHEVNNTIGAVNSILTTVLDAEKTVIAEEQEEALQMLSVARQRNYRLNRFMQNFSDVVKLPMPEKEYFDLVASIQNVTASLSSSLAERNIKIKTVLHDKEVMIVADQSQMEQVFLNVIKNSMEAIGLDGCIEITTQSPPVKITIKDDGPGLSAESLDRLFTPFYSTKSYGQGIGLTLVREILVNHGFQFRLYNREGKGAEFEIICKNQ